VFDFELYVCRHGETEWSKSGRHTSFTDLALTERGEEEARLLGKRLEGLEFNEVWTSPLLRARMTCELAGFDGVVVDDLTEWNYGEYEGLTTDEIRKGVHDWTIFQHGAPGGESIEEVRKRADRVVERCQRRILMFTSGHFCRVLAARWVGLPAEAGALIVASTGSLSVLGHARETRVIKLWNEVSFLGA
jgi:broad specificity phosphatase PhoE